MKMKEFDKKPDIAVNLSTRASDDKSYENVWSLFSKTLPFNYFVTVIQGFYPIFLIKFLFLIKVFVQNF